MKLEVHNPNHIHDILLFVVKTAHNCQKKLKQNKTNISRIVGRLLNIRLHRFH